MYGSFLSSPATSKQPFTHGRWIHSARRPLNGAQFRFRRSKVLMSYMLKVGCLLLLLFLFTAKANRQVGEIGSDLYYVTALS